MTTKIAKLFAFEILDSRGNPTIKVIAEDNKNNKACASVPSGASVGTHESKELRDEDLNRYNGKGVQKAIVNINEKIAPNITGFDLDIRNIDSILIELDGTEQKSNLGANSLLAVSLACSRLAAKLQRKELFRFLQEYYFPNIKISLPLPLVNILNGGKHAENCLDLQEFMIVPLSFFKFSDSTQCIAEVYHALKSILVEKKYSTCVGDEGGFAPNLKQNKDALDLLIQAIKKAGYKPGIDIAIALDPASSEFYKDNQYHLKSEKLSFSKESFAKYFIKLAKSYPIVSIEDPFSEDDWGSFIDLTKQIGNTMQIVGDDLYATNPNRLKKGIKKKATNSILIKPNQIGTITETADVINQAFEASFSVIISHRSGETSDSYISDLAVACGCGQIKLGAPARSERTVKYNRLLEIEVLNKEIPLSKSSYHGIQKS